MTRRFAASLCVLGLAVFIGAAPVGAAPVGAASRPSPPPVLLAGPIDPAQQTLLAFGDRSHWLQPWRGYLDTMPATTLRDAIGINFNNYIDEGKASAVARLLAASGVKRARFEIGWNNIDYSDPNRLTNAGYIRTILMAFRDNGIRPLILLNANHQAPGPYRFFDAVVTQSAPAGARQVRLDAATVAQVVPGRSGLNVPNGGPAAGIIFTSISGDVASLSRPLPNNLNAGRHSAAALRYEPFTSPQLSGGAPSPRFEATLTGWLNYVRVVTHHVRDVLGNTAFDVELWNELTFGSDFLYHQRYYDPPQVVGTGDVTSEIPARTVAWLRNPANGVAGVGITNGFESQRPWASGATSPVGLTAISKHPYKGIRRFPADAANNARGIRPLDALGRVDGVYDPATGRWRDNFTPTYDSFFPEYYLNAIQTEHSIRDLSPITTDIYGTPHGRYTKPASGDPPGMFVTEWNMDPTGADPTDPSNQGTGTIPLSEPDRKHLQAKGALRYLTSWVNKGAKGIYFYAVTGGNLALVDPDDPDGGETMVALSRLKEALDGAAPLASTTSLSLLDVGDFAGRRQFEGDGTAAHPTLFDRDVVGFFPFQVNPKKFVIPVYVMTRNIAKLYRPDAPASDVTRYDLPEERFRLTIGGLGSAGEIRVGATDPLSGRTVAASVISRSGDRVVVELPLTDSPRLLTIEAGAGLPLPQPHDYSGDGNADVIGRTSNGDLRLYFGNGVGLSGGYRVIGTGWGSLTAIFSPGDFDGDGHPDVIGRTSTGDLRLYFGNGVGLSGGYRVIGTRWGSLNALFSPGDFDGDGHPDVIGRTSTGDLRLYFGNGVGLSGGYRVIGTGWGSLTAVFSPGDFDGDGHPDVIGRTSTGDLRLYFGNGVGLSGGYRVIGTRWGSLNALFSPGDFNLDGKPDVMGRTSTGDLRLYFGNGVGLSGGYRVIGTGWNGITAIL